MRKYIATEIGLSLGAAMLSSAGLGQPGRGPATSAFTKLDLHHCSKHPQNEASEIEWRCPGFHGIPLFVRLSTGRFDVDAGEDNGIFESSKTSNRLPNQIEWRLKGGHPRSIIYRLRIADPGGAPKDLIGVETIGYPSAWAGCVVAWIDGGQDKSGQLARRMADRDHRDFRCGHDEPEDLPHRPFPR